jgi:hypothetical protein
MRPVSEQSAKMREVTRLVFAAGLPLRLMPLSPNIITHLLQAATGNSHSSSISVVNIAPDEEAGRLNQTDEPHSKRLIEATLTSRGGHALTL